MPDSFLWKPTRLARDWTTPWCKGTVSNCSVSWPSKKATPRRPFTSWNTLRAWEVQHLVTLRLHFFIEVPGYFAVNRFGSCKQSSVQSYPNLINVFHQGICAYYKFKFVFVPQFSKIMITKQLSLVEVCTRIE